MKRRLVLGLLGFALAACAAAAPARRRRFSGIWDFHFETSAFRTDSGAGPYWLSGEGEAWQAASAPLRQADGRSGAPWGRVRLVIEGELSGPGRYGHLGAYERELRVTRVLEARLISSERQPSHN